MVTGSAVADTIYVPGDQPTIQAAIDVARQLDTVVVARGTYSENINFVGKVIRLTSTAPEDPTVVAETIIDGGGVGSVVSFTGIEGAQAVLTGFTITGGLAENGGGIDCHGAAPTIAYCTISTNTATRNGGGLHECDGPISDSKIMENIAEADGGGLWGCDGTISRCAITGNNAGSGGGLMRSDAVISDSVVAENTAGGGGGLSHCNGEMFRSSISRNIASGGGGGGFSNCGTVINNCIVSGNRAQRGGAFNTHAGAITNCTIVGNFGNPTGGLYRANGGATNSIIWDNRYGQILEGLQPAFSIVTDGCSGEGCSADNPLFVTPGYWDFANGGVWVEGDYRLSVLSPAIDAGDPSFTPAPGENDLDGNPRVVNGRVDMGAFEQQFDNCDSDFDDDGAPDCIDDDIDDDEVPNLADVCDFTPRGTPVDSHGRPLGDVDGDCDNDLDDFSLLQLGVTGPLP